MQKIATLTLLSLALTASLASGLVQDGEGPFDPPLGDDASECSDNCWNSCTESVSYCHSICDESVACWDNCGPRESLSYCHSLCPRDSACAEVKCWDWCGEESISYCHSLCGVSERSCSGAGCGGPRSSSDACWEQCGPRESTAYCESLCG